MWVCFCFVNKFICTIFLDSVYKQYQYDITFSVCSFTTIVPRSIHVAANSIFSFFMAEKYVTGCMYHILFIHSSVDGYLGWFHALTLLNGATVNIEKHISFQIRIFPSFMPRVGLQDYMVTLIFGGNSILFSIVTAPIYILTKSVGGFLFPYTLSSIYFL